MKRILSVVLLVALLLFASFGCAPQDTVQDVCERAIGSVVAITTQKSYRTVFGDAEQTAYSTGFAVRGGYIVTNAHCILFEGAASLSVDETTDLADSIRCRFYSSSTEYTLAVVCYDESLDLAVLSFFGEAPDVEPLYFADSEFVRFADPAIVIGNAQGYGISVTSGIISAPEREFIFSDGSTLVGIQTDVALNEGNSGSPLLNKNASVVGIITFKIGDIGTSEGIGFAIKSNVVYDYLQANVW